MVAAVNGGPKVRQTSLGMVVPRTPGAKVAYYVRRKRSR